MSALKVVGWIVAATAALALVVVAIGWLLPERHRVSRRLVVAATPERVHALVSDVESYPRWRTRVERVEIVSAAADGGPLTFRETGDDGSILYTMEHVIPGRQLVTRIADRSLPFGGSWKYSLQATPEGTELTIVEDGEIYNPIFRFVSRFVLGHATSVERYLADLEREVQRP